MSERGAMYKVRSSELKARLSSSDDPVEVGEDTAVSVLWEVRAFSALGEECSLDVEILSRFSNRFQFPKRVNGVCLPQIKERACHFSLGEVCFRFPVHPFIMELLNHFKIAPKQLIPNSWRIMVSCMEIWLATTDGDMIKVDELVYLYRLKNPRSTSTTSLCLRLGKLGLSGTCPRHSGTGSADSFLSSRMSGKPLLSKFRETSLGCSVGEEPQV